MTSVKQYKKLPLVIVEDHHEVLPELYRAIATKHLPYQNNLLVHFDSHPDLLLNRTLKKSDIFNKDLLYEKLSIENWILPAAFAGHFSTIVWIKPPWANQIVEGYYKFGIGTDKKSGFVRVSLDILYYVSEMLYCSIDDMENVKFVDLYVIGVGHSKTGPETEEALNNKLATVQELIIQNNNQYVLDVDLDFFSTMNPFIEPLKSVIGYEKLQEIYHFKINLEDKSTIYDNQNYRIQTMSALEKLFTDLENAKEKSDVAKILKDFIPGNLKRTQVEILKQLVLDLYPIICSGEITWSFVHDAGCTCDTSENELPHHISTMEEISYLMDVFSKFLSMLAKPIMITISRSSLDDYCPPHQVNHIQNSLCSHVESKFECDIRQLYKYNTCDTN